VSVRADVPGRTRASEQSGALLFGQAMSWDQRVFEPIMLPGGRKLATLRDAALCITKLPKAEHDANEWQTAM
jgi:hypothetical protein